MPAQHPPLDAVDLILGVPDDRLAATLQALERQPGVTHRSRLLQLVEVRSVAGALQLSPAGVSVLATARDAGARDAGPRDVGAPLPRVRTTVRLRRVRQSVLTAWQDAAQGDERGHSQRPLLIQEWRGDEPVRVVSLSVDRPSAHHDEWGGDEWGGLLSAWQRRLVALGAEIDLGTVEPVASSPVTEQLRRMRHHGVDLLVRRWTVDPAGPPGTIALRPRFDALELCCRASPQDAPFLRVALRALASRLDLDAGAATSPIDLRAAIELLGPAGRHPSADENS